MKRARSGKLWHWCTCQGYYLAESNPSEETCPMLIQAW